MRPMLLAAMAAVLLWGSGPVEAQRAWRLSEAAVKQQIIQESIDAYPGNCPCPITGRAMGVDVDAGPLTRAVAATRQSALSRT